MTKHKFYGNKIHMKARGHSESKDKIQLLSTSISSH